MSQQNLLEIIPDHLFQSNSIIEIDHVQKKLHYEIERKREELRAMVGERYRDLIQAADTIEEMRKTTISTLGHIGEMISACRNLHDTHLVGFKIDEKPTQTQKYNINTSVHSIAVQIKLLMEIPEKIWICIERAEYITATQLFILARHINTGLQLHAGSKKPEMLQLQRILEQQWNSISNFNNTLLDVCQEKLQNVDINVETASSCLISLYLLDPLKSMVNLLEDFVRLYSNSSLKTTLQFHISPETMDVDIKGLIKSKIVNSVRVVLKTVELLYACFVDQEGGVVLDRLKHLYGRDSAPLIQLVRFSDSSVLCLLPPVVANHRLTPNKEFQAIAREDVKKCVEAWSIWVKDFIYKNVKELLKNVNKVKILHQIKEEALKIDVPANWSMMCSSLSVPDNHVWNNYFQPLITNRVKEIIDFKWDQVYNSFKSQIEKDLQSISDKDTKQEANINWFVWNDLIGETVIESRTDVITVMNGLMKDMWLQDRGFTPKLENICKCLDIELQKLLEDLNFYLYNAQEIIKEKENLLLPQEFDEDSNQNNDKIVIQIYLRKISETNVERILEYIVDCFKNPTLQNTELNEKSTAVYTARFIQASTYLIPNLRKCFIPDLHDSYFGKHYSQDNEEKKQWDHLCLILKEKCQFCWRKWIDISMKKLEELTAGLPKEFTLEANIDYLMVQWDLIKIEEKDDEGIAVESNIKVPSGPSLKLQEYLYAVSCILDEVVPHTLSAETHSLFIERVTEITFSHYNKVIINNEGDINQRCALQLLMDIRHVTLLLVPRENKKAMESSQEICEFLRKKIDPFDYDVFYPYIQTNLKRSVQRVQTILGSLILHHGQVTGIVGTKPVVSGGSADKTPVLLTPSSADGSHWFSLLPVTAPVNIHKKTEKTKKKPATTVSPSKLTRSDISELMTSSLPINLASARSGAASFFNSMTSDWFSGS